MTMKAEHAAVRLLTAALRTHRLGGAVVFEDSLEGVVLAHMCAPLQASGLRLLWVDSGSELPQSREMATRHGATTLYGNLPARINTAGWPARLIPVANTHTGRAGDPATPADVTLADAPTCCATVRGAPVIQHAQSLGLRLIVTGRRDGKSRAPFAHPLPEGMELLSPLWHWTSDDLNEYVDRYRLERPNQYRDGYTRPVRCWACTAETTDPRRFTYLAAHHPSEWARLKPMLARIVSATNREIDRQHSAIRAAVAL